MSNGTISGNTSKSSGGGVFIGSVEIRSTFILSGGNINNNSSQYGGGVCLFGSTFTMTGGNIRGNTARFEGGGVYLSNASIFTKTGGNIDTSNKAKSGRIAYVSGNDALFRNKTAGPRVNMDSRKEGEAYGWE